MTNRLLKKYDLCDGKVLRARFTVEERDDGVFISTAWFPEHGLEEDREVYEYETESAAWLSVLEEIISEMECWTRVKVKRG